jgi:hypothetical protein
MAAPSHTSSSTSESVITLHYKKGGGTGIEREDGGPITHHINYK